jgi:hypothetical protein
VSFASVYELELVRQGGSPGVLTTIGTAGVLDFLTQDTNYTTRVRGSSTYAGVTHVTPWSSEIRFSIGHPASSYTQAWESTVAIDLLRDQAGGPVAPANTYVYALVINVDATNVGSLQSATRFVNYVQDGSMGFQVPTSKPDPWNELISWNGGAGQQGLIITGSGWSTGVTTTNRLVGSITGIGTTTIYVSAVPNGYW